MKLPLLIAGSVAFAFSSAFVFAATPSTAAPFASPANPALATTSSSAPWVSSGSHPGDFPLAPANATAAILADSADFKVVQIAANLFAEDVERVTGRKPAVLDSAAKVSGPVVILGTL